MWKKEPQKKGGGGGVGGGGGGKQQGGVGWGGCFGRKPFEGGGFTLGFPRGGFLLGGVFFREPPLEVFSNRGNVLGMFFFWGFPNPRFLGGES